MRKRFVALLVCGLFAVCFFAEAAFAGQDTEDAFWNDQEIEDAWLDEGWFDDLEDWDADYPDGDYPDWYFDDGYMDAYDPAEDYDWYAYDEYGYEDAYGEYEEWWPEDTYTDDERWWAEDDYEESVQVDEAELLTWENGLGSASELDGNIVVVSIFLDDDQTKWDFGNRNADVTMRANSLQYLGIATQWISDNAEQWGKEPVFFYNWEEDAQLYYETEIVADVTDEEEDPSEELSDFIDQYIYVDELLERYEADSIVFMAFVNTPSGNSEPSYTLPFDDSIESPYEIVYILTRCDGEIENPATYAHEILHTFGAPDLYTDEFPAYNYNIDSTYVAYCEEHHANEIMFTTYDAETLESYYDHISNELTDITAYYIGWTDTCEDVELFHLQPSQHVKNEIQD